MKIFELFQKNINIFETEKAEQVDKLLESRAEFYGEFDEKYEMTKGNYEDYHVYKELEPIKKKNIKWRLTRRLGEPVITSISNSLYRDDGIKVNVQDDDVVLPASIMRNTIQALLPKEILTRQNCKKIARYTVVDGVCFLAVSWEDNKIKKEAEIPKKVYDYLKIIDEEKDDKDDIYKKDFKTNVVARDGKYYSVTEYTNTRPVVDVITGDNVFYDPFNDDIQDMDFFGYYKKTTIKRAEELTGESLAKIKRLIDTETDESCYIATMFYKKAGKLYEAMMIAKDDQFTDVTSANVIYNNEYKTPFDGIPVVFVKGFDGDDPIYGDGLAQFTADIQKMQKAMINGIVDNITRANFRTTFVRKNAIDDEGMKAYFNGYPIVEVNARQGSLRDVIFSPDFAPIPSSSFTIINQLSEYAKDEAGVGRDGDLKAYAPSSNYQSALKVAKVKEEDIILNAEFSLGKLGKMMAHYISKRLSIADMERISGVSVEQEIIKHADAMAQQVEQSIGVPLEDDMKEELRLISEKEVIKTLSNFDIEWDITVKIDSESRKSEQINKILAFIQTIRSTGEQVSQKVNQLLGSRIAELMDFKDIANELYQSAQPDPFTEELKQLELDAKKAEISKTQALAENAQARADMLKNKTYKEAVSPVNPQEADVKLKEAKALNLNADANKKIAEANNIALGGIQQGEAINQ